MKVDLRHGDSFEVLWTLAADSVDSVVTDPPYGIGFMGKAWDHADIQERAERRASGTQNLTGRTRPRFAPAEEAGKYDLSPTANRRFQDWTETWAREAFSILKPGGHLLSFCSTRTSHRMVSGIEDAGFEIRDTIHWTFGSGFPKSHNLKGAWEGWGTALKPAHEHIVLARKPLEGTVAQNVSTHGVGALNIDASRVQTNGANPSTERRQRGLSAPTERIWPDRRTAAAFQATRPAEENGRWPPNMLLTHQADCRRVGQKTVRGDGHAPASRGESPIFGPSGGGGLGGQEDLMERTFGPEVVDQYECLPGCPVRLLDEQSGESSSNRGAVNRSAKDTVYAGVFRGQPDVIVGHDDEGTASRFFPVSTWQDSDFEWLPFYYHAKAARGEREGGLEALMPRRFEQSGGASRAVDAGTDYEAAQGIGLNQVKEVRNFHPTVKPIGLMEWLVRLVTPDNGVLLDPFMGSGTTGCAAVRLKRRFIGVELDADYMTIAKARIAYHGQPLLDGVPRPERSLADFLGGVA